MSAVPATHSASPSIQALLEQAYALHRGGRREEALDCADRAVDEAPSDPNALNTRGMILNSLDRQDEALADFECALALRPGFADAINNRGTIYAHRGDFKEALACYERALSLAPELPHVRYNLGTTHLVLGNWAQGFREFEVRWRLFPHEAVRRHRLAPAWLGERNIAGKTVLLHHEQGYGDSLQFARYVPLVERLGARVIVAVPAGLRRLMRTLPGGATIIGEGERVPPHDFSCGLMSLPLAFGTTPESVPAEIPYLRADTARAHAWRTRLPPSGRVRIGVAWAGRRYPPINYPRDTTLETLRPLFDLDADFISLQQDLTESERPLLASLSRVKLAVERFEDFSDTAALIDGLDLIITVDTAIAHLAGALGKPVWVLNRYASCWRWMLERTDSPWYPTLRLFRQPSLGDWGSVMREVGAVARELIARQPWGSNLSLVEQLNVALAAHRAQRLPQAVAAYRAVLQSHPRQPEALHYLGVALAQQGEYQEALAKLSEVRGLQPKNAAACVHLGNALSGLLRHEEAVSSYEHAIRLDESSADAHYNCGVALAHLGRHEAAIRHYERALRLRPSHADTHNNLGNALIELGRLSEALECYERARALDVRSIDAWVNCANVLRRLHRHEDALKYSDHALQMEGERAEAHCGRGAALAGMGRRAEALLSYRRAIELQPALAEGLWNKALVHLAQGEFEEGWSLYEARWKVKSLRLTQQYPAQPRWHGTEALEGKVVLLHAEQGYGDTIQFSRYATLVAARGARVILGVPSALASLMSSLAGVAQILVRGAAPVFDYHSPLLSLPLAFGTSLSDIPAPLSYLSAEKAARRRWATRLGPRQRPRVGLAWSGKASHTNDANRSIPLRECLTLSTCPAEFVSVQKEIRSDDTPALDGLPGLRCFGDELIDFGETAALISELDLVITVDTAVAHLAGALGKPVWILLPHVADWRWLLDRADSPWYPSARLFRQDRPGDWSSVIAEVAAELRTLPHERPAGGE
jgi:hypothetical protein